MSILNQKTISNPIKISGIGLHTGKHVNLSIFPAAPNTGITFKRIDVKDMDNIVEMSLKNAGLWDEVKDRLDSPGTGLSGGQQQRAAIARALCMEPSALLFDEPTSALDPELEQEVIKVIKDLAQEGRTMIIVTHDMSLAADVSDHIIFLHMGLIEEEGSPNSLFKSPKSERLQKFLSSTRAA